ncbi:glycosyltransferase family 2 protein [Brevibacterium album]|uniref:glycosyltransferase family 2 protein n=1 Tax=Brevibacterium album TaxID=417948 RepID=UPI00048C2E5B|nr:glycosyltransferase family 2 protein [Brevibacterium album]
MPARSSAQWAADRPGGARGCPDPAPDVEVLVPCFERPAALAVTLSGLAAQLEADFDVVLSDQSPTPVWEEPAVAGMIRLLRAQGRRVRCLRNLPRRGLAQQRQHLLEASGARLVLFLDSDVWLEPGTVSRLRTALDAHGCGFMGSAVQGLSFLGDRRPGEWESFEPWEGRVEPEAAPRDGPAHERWRLHSAANLAHLAAETELGDAPFLVYRIAWVGGCVLYDRAKLLDSGGFGFWDTLPPEHAGEDVLAQWRMMPRWGGAAVLPSGAVHLEAPTTVEDRSVEATDLLAEESEG